MCFTEGHNHDATPCSNRLKVPSVVAICLTRTATDGTTGGITAFVYGCYGVAGCFSWTLADWCVATRGSLRAASARTVPFRSYDAAFARVHGGCVGSTAPEPAPEPEPEPELEPELG